MFEGKGTPLVLIPAEAFIQEPHEILSVENIAQIVGELSLQHPDHDPVILFTKGGNYD